MGAKSINNFCESVDISRSSFYKLEKRGKAPKTFKVGGKRFISDQAESEWVEMMEQTGGVSFSDSPLVAETDTPNYADC